MVGVLVGTRKGVVEAAETSDDETIVGEDGELGETEGEEGVGEERGEGRAERMGGCKAEKE